LTDRTAVGRQQFDGGRIAVGGRHGIGDVGAPVPALHDFVVPWRLKKVSILAHIAVPAAPLIGGMPNVGYTTIREV
jgi:hypothetical protein